MARTKDFLVKYGAKLSKQVQPTPATDLYGGGTVPSLGTGNLMKFDNLEITDTPEFFTDAANNSSIFEPGQELAAVPVAVTGETKFYTQGLEHLLASCFGFEELSGPENYSTTEYSHLLSLTTNGKDQRIYTSTEAADATANLSFSPAYAAGDYINTYINLIRDLGPSEEKITNVSIDEFTISAASKEPLKIQFSGKGEVVERDTGHTEADALTAASGAFEEWFMLRHCTAKFGAVGALVERDIFDFSIKVSHGQADIFPTGTSNSGLSRSEPVATGMSEVSVEMTINAHDTDDYKTWEQGNTLLQASFSFTRTPDKAIFLLPALKMQSVEIMKEDGSRVKVTLKGFQPTAADPFTTERSISGTEQTLTYTTPFYMMLSNQFSSNTMRVSA